MQDQALKRHDIELEMYIRSYYSVIWYTFILIEICVYIYIYKWIVVSMFESFRSLTAGISEIAFTPLHVGSSKIGYVRKLGKAIW